MAFTGKIQKLLGRADGDSTSSAFANERMRYLGSAVICAGFNNILLIVAARAGMGLVNITLLSFVVAGSLGYALHVRFTFRRKPGWSSYARFMTGVAVGVPAAYTALALLCSVLKLPMVIAAPAQTVLMAIYHFLNARLAIMGRRLVKRAES